MKAFLKVFAAIFALAALVEARIPSGAFKPSEYQEALAKAKESGRPIAVVVTDTASSCPKCQTGNEEVFKRMRSKYVMVVEDQADKGEKLAPEVARKTHEIFNQKGNIIPIVTVLSEDDERLLGGLCYNQIAKDGRNAFRTLEKEVEQAKAAGAAAQPEKVDPKAGDDPATGEACETGGLREWTNTQGQTIKARALKVSDTEVTFELENGRVVHYPLENLSDKSRQEAREACR